MSHSSGVVIRESKIVGFFEYDGTADFAMTHIYDTFDDMWEKWRVRRDTACTCGREPHAVILYADYGGGFFWNSTACLDCHVITGQIDPYPDHETDDSKDAINGYPPDCETPPFYRFTHKE